METCNCCQCSKKCFLGLIKENKLLVATTVAVLIGISFGLLLRETEVSYDIKTWIRIWGELFLRMLKLIILPLIISCLITGSAQLSGTAGGILCTVTVMYILITQVIACLIGVIFALLVKPGQRWHLDHIQKYSDGNNADFSGLNVSAALVSQRSDDYTEDNGVNYSDIFTDLLRNLFPDNIVKACMQNSYTAHTEIPLLNSFMANETNLTEQATQLVYRDGTNMLGIILFSLAIGFGTGSIGEDGKPLYKVFYALQKIMFMLMKAVLYYSPVGIASLIASSIMDIKDISVIMASVGLYVGGFLICFAIHQFVVLPAIFFAFLRKNPFSYYYHYLLDAVIAGFAAVTSVVAIPIIYNKINEKQKNFDKRVTDFVFPMCLSINRDGSGMYVCYTLIFIAQTHGIQLNMADVVIIWLLGSILSAAVAGVPSGGVMLMLTMAPAVNIAIGDRLAIIMALEWLLDRVRTTNNIASTGYGIAIVEKITKGRLTEKQSESEKLTHSKLLLSEMDSEEVKVELHHLH